MDDERVFTDRPDYSFGEGPPPDFSGYLNNKNLKPSFSWQDVEPEEHAVQFAVAKATSVDVLQTVLSDLQKALEEGVPFEKFKRELEPRLQSLGWWGTQEVTDPLTGEKQLARLGSPRRLRTIYDANMRSARAAGHWGDIQRSRRALPFLLYQLGPSENHRPEHVARENIILPVDDPFWQVWFPPNGWGCKCRVRAISRREAERRGISKSPEIETREWVNRRTGEVKQIPVGIDPGWERNPGVERQRHMERYLSGKLDGADPAIARTVAADMTDSWRFRRVQDGSAPGIVPVGIVPDPVRDILGTSTSVISFSAETAAKQIRKRPELEPDAYMLLRRAFEDDATLYREANKLVAFFEDDDGKVWQATFKRTRDGKEIFLDSLYRSDARRRLNFIKRDGVSLVEGNVSGRS